MTSKFPTVEILLDADQRPIGLSIDGVNIEGAKVVHESTVYESNKRRVAEVTITLLTDRIVEHTNA